MALSAEMKSILVCPKCRGNLEFREDLASIRCLACRVSYPIVEDIPVLLMDQATPLAPDKAKPEGG